MWGPFDEHDVRREFNRRRLLQAALAGAGMAAGLPACSDPETGATSGVRTSTTQVARTTTSVRDVILAPGTRPFPDRPEGADMLPEIEHVVMYMQENHSYDSYYATLRRGDGLKLGKDGRPTNSNVNSAGETVTCFHQVDTCNPVTGDHGWSGTIRSINGGAMDGFAKASGDSVMGYFDESNVPFYHGLASTYPLCDRWFSSVHGPTHPNRRYMIAATSAGMTVTDVAEVLAHPSAPNGTIFDRLDAHGISWVDYAIDYWDALLYPGTDVIGFLNRTTNNRKYFDDFLADCRNGTLPQVSVLGPGTSDQYDEGSRDVQNGEAYSYSIINAVMDSPLWDKTAIFFTYDEHGGCYDHVPPPAAIAPDDVAPRLKPGDEPGDFARYGVRVPGFVISPYAKKDYVSHVVHDHTSMLKFIETKWNLGALTYRDANADNFFDCFDFDKKSFPEPPVLPEPGLPSGGSACQPQPRPAVNPSTR